MNVLIVYAHPNPQSLNGSLKDFAVQHLQQQGHQVKVSDLYAMRWKAQLDAARTSAPLAGGRYDESEASRFTFENHLHSADIATEQEKLRWADSVIFQFPLWWFSMPAIMKGWFDRVFAEGFAYGVGEHNDQHWGDRYGEGNLTGKRAMLVITTGGWESHYSPRGINGAIDDLLFPIQHGMLFYPGFSVLPPLVFYQTQKLDRQSFAHWRDALAKRLDTLAEAEPIPFRRQNGGDYEIPALTLKEELAVGKQGLSMHLAE